ncbi:helix-turn-helix domain-containing protein [Microbacterium lacticum]|uniref:helix-turn-helix domain-containing protein n=1 Tax=Microbacterium lacticum TaxID=33885 RepID=UPI0028D44D8B|nr:helix-turn-helix domain-containing protein [Microbacterium lacticum]
MARSTPPLSELPERMLSPAEVADRLGISYQTVWKMIQRGDLPAYKIARRIRVPEEAVIAALRPVISAKDGDR